MAAPANSPNRNGNGAEFVSDPTSLFGPAQRRTQVVTISDPSEVPPRKVVVRAMSAGERRKFLARAQMTKADGTVVSDMSWYNTGNRNRVVLALCCSRYDGTPLFPDAWQAAIRILDDPNASASALADLDNLEPVVETLLVQAADEISLITPGSVDRLTQTPLAPKSASSTDLEPASEESTPSTPSAS